MSNRVSRKAVTVLLLSLVVVAAAVAVTVPLLLGWTGDQVFRELQPGQSVTLESGLTFTVPVGWQGYYTKFYRIPSWLPIGEGASGLGRSEYLDLRPVQSTDSAGVAALTYYGTARPPGDPGKVVATGQNVVLRDWGPGIRIETSLPGSSRGYVLVPNSKDSPQESAKEYWSLFGVRGVLLP